MPGVRRSASYPDWDNHVVTGSMCSDPLRWIPSWRRQSMTSLAPSLATSARTRSPGGRMDAWRSTDIPLTPVSASKSAQTRSVSVAGEEIRRCSMGTVSQPLVGAAARRGDRSLTCRFAPRVGIEPTSLVLIQSQAGPTSRPTGERPTRGPAKGSQAGGIPGHRVRRPQRSRGMMGA